jgi:ATP-binding cassette subfamily F protein uup
LVGWPGTLLLVSHDRTFLDNVVTSTLVFEGNGVVREYVGGYEDWLRQRPLPPEPVSPKPKSVGVPAGQAGAASGGGTAPKKLSYREQREFEELPGRIDALEAEQRNLNTAIQDPLFYTKPADDIRASLARLDALGAELAAAYGRWDELDARATRSTPAPSSASRLP